MLEKFVVEKGVSVGRPWSDLGVWDTVEVLAKFRLAKSWEVLAECGSVGRV